MSKAEPLQTYELTCCEGERWVTLALFVAVKNAGKLRSDVTQGKLEAALLEPTLVASPFHVLSAVNKAVVNSEHGQLKTRNVFSEIIFSLSPSTNISDSFKKFGIKDLSENLLIVILHKTRESSQVGDLLKVVDGDLVSLEHLTNVHDENAIKKLYKIPSEESEISSLENSIVTRMITRDVT